MTTTLNLAALQALTQTALETGMDMTEQSMGGGGNRKELPVGAFLGRIVGYVERGDQAQYHEGKLKEKNPYQPEIQLSIECWGEGYENDDGTAYVEHLYPFAVTRTDRSNAFKNFAVLNYDGQATHWIQLVGKAFLFEVVKAKSKATGKEYTKIDLSKTRPPLDALTKRPYPVNPVTEKNLRVFLFEHPQLEHWDMLPEFTQNDILGANNFAGSPLEQLLLSAGKNTVHKPREAKGAKKASESGAAGPDSGAAGPDAPLSAAEQAIVDAADAPFDGGKPFVPATPAMPGMMDC